MRLKLLPIKSIQRIIVTLFFIGFFGACSSGNDSSENSNDNTDPVIEDPAPDAPTNLVEELIGSSLAACIAFMLDSFNG